MPNCYRLSGLARIRDAVQHLQTPKLQLFPIESLESAKAKLFEAAPDWTPVTISARTYPGQNQDLLVPGTHTVLLAHRQADSAMIYQIVKTIIEHREEFGDLHPGGREFTVEKTRFFVEKNLVPIAFHPGAERYWRGAGVLK